jgi:hypothetical protein
VDRAVLQGLEVAFDSGLVEGRCGAPFDRDGSARAMAEAGPEAVEVGVAHEAASPPKIWMAPS